MADSNSVLEDYGDIFTIFYFLTVTWLKMLKKFDFCKKRKKPKAFATNDLKTQI